MVRRRSREREREAPLRAAGGGGDTQWGWMEDHMEWTTTDDCLPGEVGERLSRRWMAVIVVASEESAPEWATKEKN